jgi:N-acetylneuraminic acid mutarotase
MSSAFTYQGQLYDANYVANGLYDFQFKLWTDPCRSEALFKIGDDVNVPNVDVIDGYFTVELDGFMPIPWWAFDGDGRWLEIGIRPGDQNDPNTYSTLSPRQEITPTPYGIHAMRSEYAGSAGDAGTLGGYSYTDFAWSVHMHSGLEITSGTVAEGYIDSLIARDSEIMSWVLGGDGSGSTLDADLLDGQDSAAFAVASHNHDGVYANWSHSHDGSHIISGIVSAARIDGAMATDTELTTGLATKADITHNHDDSYVNEAGDSMSGPLNVTSPSGYGVRGETAGAGWGLYGYASASSGATHGVYGEANNSPQGYGGYFSAGTDSSGTGVYGYSRHGKAVRGESSDGVGVYGESSDSNGVYGESTSGHGVHGKSTSGYAGYFEGEVKVSGGGYGVEFPDGTVQTTAAESVPSGFCFFGDSSTPPVGYTFTGSVLISDEDGSWRFKADMPTARYFLAAAAVNGKIYAIGGHDTSDNELDTNEEYDPATNSWISEANMPTARYKLAAVAVNGKIYAIGGHDGTFNKSTNEEYDPVADSWMSVAVMPEGGRRGLAAAVVNGKIYVIGGYDGSYLDTNEEYDPPPSNSWASEANMPTARSFLAAAAVNGKIYAIGGSNGSYLHDTDEYDPVGNTWTPKADMPSPARNNLAAAAANGRIYAIGGYDGSNDLQDNDEYDPVADSWMPMADMPSPGRRDLAAAAVNGKIYAIGGYDGSNELQDNDEYTPPALFYLHKKD